MTVFPAKAGIQMAGSAVGSKGSVLIQPISPLGDLGPGLRRGDGELPNAK